MTTYEVIWEADPYGYTILPAPIIDTGVPHGGIVPVTIHNVGHLREFNWDNGTFAGLTVPYMPDVNEAFVNGAVTLGQDGPPGGLAAPWLAAVHVVEQFISYGSGFPGDRSNWMVWTVGGGTEIAGGVDRVLFDTDGSPISESDPNPVLPGVLPGTIGPSGPVGPYWIGVSSVVSDSPPFFTTYAGIWYSFDAPEINSIPDRVLASSIPSSFRDAAVTSASCVVNWNAGAYATGGTVVTQSGGGTFALDAFVFMAGAPVVVPLIGGLNPGSTDALVLPGGIRRRRRILGSASAGAAADLPGVPMEGAGQPVTSVNALQGIGQSDDGDGPSGIVRDHR